MSIYGAGAQNVTPPLTGAEQVTIDGGGAVVAQTTTQAIADLAQGSRVAATALNTVGAGTITAAGIAGGVVVRGGAQSNTGFTDTTATAAAIIAASASLAGNIGASILVTYQNTTDANATIAGGTGVTVSGVTLVPGKTTAMYLLTYTAANTITMVGISLTLPTTVSGTFVCNGVTPVTVADKRITASSSVVVTLKTVGGTVGAVPAIQTITAGTGFTIAGTAADTSTYNYLILN